MAIVMTSAQFIQKLRNIVNRPNVYRNSFPYNLGYYNGYSISFDCWNLVKALVNEPSIDQNYKVGHYAPASGNMADIDGWNILMQCSGVSQNFSNLVPGEFLYMSGHAGIFIGNGQVIECTTDWSGGCQISSITSTGGRHKNGVWGRSWSYHGKLTKWINYDVQPSVKILVDGEWGYNTTFLAQKIFGTTQDGEVSNQDSNCKKYCLNCIPKTSNSGSWVWNNGSGYSPLIKAIQKWCGATQDGKFGVNTIKALQKKLGVTVDGYCGIQTVRAFQSYLNSQVK